jgi:hypothetical protein
MPWMTSTAAAGYEEYYYFGKCFVCEKWKVWPEFYSDLEICIDCRDKNDR